MDKTFVGATGFVSPSGDFYACKQYEHDCFALSVLKTPVSWLEQRGWARVIYSSIYPNHIDFLMDELKMPTEEQIRTLRSLGVCERILKTL